MVRACVVIVINSFINNNNVNIIMVMIMFFFYFAFFLFCFVFCYGFNKCKFEIKGKTSNGLKSLLYFLLFYEFGPVSRAECVVWEVAEAFIPSS